MRPQNLRAILKEAPYIDQAAWSVNEALHHKLPHILRRRNRNGAIKVSTNAINACTARSCPTYPYPETDTDPLLPRAPNDVQQPVLTAADVTDYGQVDFVADPFLYPGRDHWHMFFEVYTETRDPNAVIGHATSANGYHWEYDRIVLNTGEHLSFPYVFGWDGNHYMIPEEGGSEGTCVTLYEAKCFPHKWTQRATLVREVIRTDDTIAFRWNDRWWILVGDSEKSCLRAYHSDDLLADEWTPHEENPVVTDRPTAERPAGRPIVRSDRIVTFFQDCVRRYGDKVRAFEITALTPTTYEDRELPRSPVLQGSESRIGWNSGTMHHIDPWYTGDHWLCAVDGNVDLGHELLTARHYSIGIYTSP